MSPCPMGEGSLDLRREGIKGEEDGRWGNWVPSIGCVKSNKAVLSFEAKCECPLLGYVPPVAVRGGDDAGSPPFPPPTNIWEDLFF